MLSYISNESLSSNTGRPITLKQNRALN